MGVVRLLVLLCLAWSALGRSEYSSYDYGFDIGALVKRQTQQPIVVTRLPLINGTVPVRLEIRQMKQDPFKWNLFLLGLSMLQFADPNQQLSWYQIAGIHGIPFNAWNGVQGVPGGEGRGYCTHMSTLFPSWHRPYLALYEQVLFRLVQAIAAWFPDPTEREAYTAAAANFRIPYWDWAGNSPLGDSLYLDEFGEPGIPIYGPNGWQYIANPLFTYKFRTSDVKSFAPGNLSMWTETKRSPVGNTSRDNWVAQRLEQNLPFLQQRIHTLLSNYKDYGPFSNKFWATANNLSQSGFDSVESLHDAIHIIVGDYGHMYYLDYSAFDPIFFLHHAMTDRIIAMWQDLYPTSWVIPQAAIEPTFTTPRGTIQDSFTSLTPFYAGADGIFWNSAMARDTTAFGYAYPETVVRPVTGRSTARARLISTINRLYGTSSPSRLIQDQTSGRAKRRQEGLPVSRKGAVAAVLEVPDFSTRHAVGDPPTSSIINNNQYTEWLVNIRVKNDALGGPFAIHFYFGPPTTNKTRWAYAPNLVGTMSVLAMSGMHSNSYISSTVPLTAALMHVVATGAIRGLDGRKVEQYLRQNIRFRIVTEHQVDVDPLAVDGLNIAVASSRVQAARTKWELPSWGPIVKRFDMV